MPKVSIPLRGGLNVLPNRLLVRPGQMVSCSNYEVTKNGDVRRISGYRQFSGGCFNGPVTHVVAGRFPGSTYSGGDEWMQWGLAGGVYAEDGTLAEYSGRARIPWSVSMDSTGDSGGGVAYTFQSLLEGRALRPPERITQRPSGGTLNSSFFSSPNPRLLLQQIGDLVLTSDFTRFTAYQYHNVLNDKFLASRTEPPLSSLTGWTLDAEDVPSVDAYGRTIGGAFFKDRLYVVADLQCFRFTNCTQIPSVGDVLQFVESGNDIERVYVEQVIVESGSVGSSDATGRLIVSGGFPGAAPNGGPIADPLASTSVYSNGYSLANATTANNVTTSTNNVMTITAYLDPELAALYRSTSPFDVASATYTPAWERIDLGYEVGFQTGGNPFVVANRTALEDDLLALTSPVTTAWAFPGALTVGGSSVSVTPVAADDGTTYSFSTFGGNLAQHPTLVVSDFDIDVPDYSTIIGVEVEINCYDGAGVSVAPQFLTVSLKSGEALYGNLAPGGSIPTATGTLYNIGGADQLWGASLSPADVRSADFGVAFVFSAQDVEIDYIRVRVTYKPYEETIYFFDPNAAAIAVTSVTRSGNTVTVTTTQNHGYATGQTATIAGAAQAEYNGTHAITVTGASTFTYTITTTPTTPASGTITAKLADVSTAKSVWYHKREGDFTTTDAKGVLTIYAPSHPNYIKGNQRIRSAAANAGTLYALTTTGAERVFLPSSKDIERESSQYEWTEGNFYSDDQYKQLFWCNGAGPAFSYDGKYAIRIRPNLTDKDNKPRHIAVFGTQLGLGFSFGDVFLSDDGEPESFAAVVNGSSPPSRLPDFNPSAEQIPFADRIHGLIRLPQQSMAVFCDRSIQRITGAPGAFATQVVRDGDGCVEYTAKNLNGMVCYTDVRGISVLRATDLFGDVIPQYVSYEVGPWLDPRINRNDPLPLPGIVACEVVPNKDQYRLFFGDGKALTMTLVGNQMEPMFSIQDYAYTVSWACTGIFKDALHQQFFAFNRESGRSAKVYQMDVGTTFDSEPIVSRAEFYLGEMSDDLKGVDKQFEHIGLDASCYGFASLGVSYRTTGIPRDALAGAQKIPLTLGKSSLGDYLTKNTYRQTASVGGKGDTLIVQFESDGVTDYGTATTPTDFRYLMPHELVSVTVHFQVESDENPAR